MKHGSQHLLEVVAGVMAAVGHVLQSGQWAVLQSWRTAVNKSVIIAETTSLGRVRASDPNTPCPTSFPLRSNTALYRSRPGLRGTWCPLEIGTNIPSRPADKTGRCAPLLAWAFCNNPNRHSTCAGRVKGAKAAAEMRSHLAKRGNRGPRDLMLLVQPLPHNLRRVLERSTCRPAPPSQGSLLPTTMPKRISSGKTESKPTPPSAGS